MLKFTPIALLPVLIVLCLSSTAHPQSAKSSSFKVGVTSRRVVPPEPYDWRGATMHVLLGTVWSPAESDADAKPQLIPPFGTAIFEAAPAAANAKIAASRAKFPLILLSHGTGGTVQSLAWFATALASHGYIVAGVNHPGNNAIEPHTVQGFMLWWERARDISTLLDAMLADQEFGPRIDTQRIGAAGFSLGGYTVIELAGGITASRRFIEACKAAPDQVSCKAPPEFPDLAAKAEALAAADPNFAEAIRAAGGSYRDPRIRAVFAMAPALGPAVTAESLKAIGIPTAIVAGERDSIVPIDASARYYAAEIPGAELTIFPGAVDHYTFLDVCTDAGRRAIPPICIDRPGVDREAIHNATIDLATKFFGSHMSAH
jgi:predicted dienelactone hydrolase